VNRSVLRSVDDATIDVANETCGVLPEAYWGTLAAMMWEKMRVATGDATWVAVREAVFDELLDDDGNVARDATCDVEQDAIGTET